MLKGGYMYPIEELEKTFLLHHKKAVKENQELIKRYKEDYPGEPLPDHLESDFSLPLALHSICLVIAELRRTAKTDTPDP